MSNSIQARFDQLIASYAPLYFYSSYNFERAIPQDRLIALQESKFRGLLQKGKYAAFGIDGETCIAFFERLGWDSDYFGFENYKLHLMLCPPELQQRAVAHFQQDLLPAGAYCFMEVPTEDTNMLQALTANAFRLIETRLTYYHNRPETHQVERYPVRAAGPDDTDNLMRVAREMRNVYDRFHADPVFGYKLGDEFLATYIEQSIKGFSDYVLTSAAPGLPSDAFLTANYLKDEWKTLGYPISKMVLSAVSATTNKGWYVKLISEMLYHLRDEIGAKTIFLNTQSTNRAVFSTWEKLGFRLGCTTHVLSFVKAD